MRDHAGAPGFHALMRSPRRLGLAVAVAFFGIFGGWAAATPLSSAAVAPGVVSPDGNRKTVQHLEGGIIRDILVREGDTVEAGQPLVLLDDTHARAELQELRERGVHFLATEARLVAEQAGADDIAFPDELLSLDGSDVEKAIRGQRALLTSRRASLDGREQILIQRVRQLEEESHGLGQVIAAQDDQIALIDQEIANVEALYRQGLERLPRLLSLRRDQAALRAEQAANRARIARNAQQVGETRIQILTMRQQQHEQITEQLAGVRAELARLRSLLPSRQDVLARTVVTAPIPGVVMNVQVTTQTGVVRPGQAVLDIVPLDSPLIIDARVRPVDIDEVRPGMTTRLILSAYRQRTMPLIFGTVRSVSADRLVDEATGEPYFLAQVQLAPEDLARVAPDLRLAPGMPVEVMILNGERTMLDYLIRPFMDSLLVSFRES